MRSEWCADAVMWRGQPATGAASGREVKWGRPATRLSLSYHSLATHSLTHSHTTSPHSTLLIKHVSFLSVFYSPTPPLPVVVVVLFLFPR